MQNTKTIHLKDYTLHLVPTKKFKTVHFVAKFKSQLKRDFVTTRALIPYLLMQGTNKYPTRQDIEEKLDDLYGAVLSASSSKKGNNHLISVRFSVANEKFINSNTILTDALAFFNEILFNPSVENDQFSHDIIEREKLTLQQKIESLIDDKVQYANMRLINEMCKQEAFHIPAHGYTEDLSGISPKAAYAYYKQMVEQDDLDIYILGDIEPEVMEKKCRAMIKREKEIIDRKNESNQDIIKDVKETKEIIEKQPIQQAKLHIGYRTNCTYKDDAYPSLLVFNGLFGAFPSSKLFIHVRERNSLAYYAASRIESHKGLLFVFSGIAPRDYKAAKTIIEQQLKAMQEGDFTEKELEKTKELLIHQFLETLDNPQGIIEMLYQQEVAQRDLSPYELIEQIRSVNKKDCIAIANQIKEDTVYLLTDKRGDLNE